MGSCRSAAVIWWISCPRSGFIVSHTSHLCHRTFLGLLTPLDDCVIFCLVTQNVEPTSGNGNACTTTLSFSLSPFFHLCSMASPQSLPRILHSLLSFLSIYLHVGIDSYDSIYIIYPLYSSSSSSSYLSIHSSIPLFPSSSLLQSIIIHHPILSVSIPWTCLFLDLLFFFYLSRARAHSLRLVPLV